MLPVGANVRQVYPEGGVLESAAPGTLMIDSSTIDVESSRAVHAAAKAAGFDMLDAPVSVASRGPMRARHFHVWRGGFRQSATDPRRHGKNIVHCGEPGLGQATKICNNMLEHQRISGC